MNKINSVFRKVMLMLRMAAEGIAWVFGVLLVWEEEPDDFSAWREYWQKEVERHG